MFLDFEFLLVALAAITLVTVAWAALLRRRRRAAGQSEPDKENWWVDLCRSLLPVVLIVLVIRSFLVEPFRIPSGSMIPTLLAGDFVLVNKFSYGLRLPVLNTTFIPTGEPDRGDVAVFKYPRDASQDFIKRVVGVPGDTVRYDAGQLVINGERVEREGIGEYNHRQAPRSYVFSERLGGQEYQTLRLAGRQGCSDYASSSDGYTVPEGHYFVMGDNRDSSSDSRCWGPVSDDRLVGRAFLIWMSWNGHENTINWDRIGTMLND